jgi:hypothetical protein
VRVFKTRDFAHFARRERIGDAALCDAVARAGRGLVDASLGGGLIKRRVARRGQGRSGGFRTIIAYRRADRCFFIYGFAKSERDNVTDIELSAMKIVSAEWMSLTPQGLDKAVKEQRLSEVFCDE